MVLILSFCFLNKRQNILLSASRWQVYFDLMKLNFPFTTLLLLDVLSALFFFYFPQTVQPLLPLLSLSLSEVQCVLLGDLLVLLQKQDDKMVLKCQSKSNIAVQEGKQMLSPIIKLDSVFLREVATGQQARSGPDAPSLWLPSSDQSRPTQRLFSLFLSARSKSLLRDIHLGEWRSDLWTGGSVRQREQIVGSRRENDCLFTR